MKKQLLIFILMGLLVGCSSAPSHVKQPPPTLQEAKQVPQKDRQIQPPPILKNTNEIETLLNNIHSMQATFEQILRNQKGKKIGEKITGFMMLKRPGKFRWETIKPNKQLIVVNKNVCFLYDVDLEQVTKRKINSKQPGNPAILLSGSTESLKKSFKVTRLKNNKFILTPKNRESFYQTITINFINGKPVSMHIIDNLDQKSSIVFKNIKINHKISPKLFIFNPPPGTEVLENP